MPFALTALTAVSPEVSDSVTLMSLSPAFRNVRSSAESMNRICFITPIIIYVLVSSCKDTHSFLNRCYTYWLIIYQIRR